MANYCLLRNGVDMHACMSKGEGGKICKLTSPSNVNMFSLFNQSRPLGHIPMFYRMRDLNRLTQGISGRRRFTNYKPDKLSNDKEKTKVL